MKGTRSGVQKLIKVENPFLYDAGCICHLADLTVKAGMLSLPVDIVMTSFLLIYFTISFMAVRGSKKSMTCGAHSTSEPETILKHCTTRWLSLLRCVDRYITQYDGLI